MSDFQRFSYDEFFRGAAAAIASVFIIGWWGVLLAAGCGILWMLGGTYHKAIRRWLVPAAIAVTCGFNFLAFAPGVAILHIGDGYPDHRVSTWDSGSALGQFVERVWDLHPDAGGAVTKWLIVLIFQISWLVQFI